MRIDIALPAVQIKCVEPDDFFKIVIEFVGGVSCTMSREESMALAGAITQVWLEEDLKEKE